MTSYEKRQCRILNIPTEGVDTLKDAYSVASEEVRTAMRLGAKMRVSEKTEIEEVVSSSNASYIAVKEHFDFANGEEQIFAMLLTAKNEVLATIDITGKSMPSGAELDLRRLLKPVLVKNASAVILAHNHPSGNLHASREDISLTNRISEILTSIGVTLLDHLVVTVDGYSKVEI